MRIKNLQFLAIIIVSLILLGVEGCPAGGGGTASQTGIDFSLISGIDKLSSGKTFNQGDTFNAEINIENYDKKAKTGEVCISDDQDKYYGGIESQCIPFAVKAAEITESAKSGFFSSAEKVTPGTTKVILPAEGQYSYHNLLSTQNIKAYVSLKYQQSSEIEGQVSIPTPEQEYLVLSEEPAPVSATVNKEISRQENSYKISLGVQLSKNSQATLYSPGKNEENFISFKVSMPPKSVSCEPSENDDKTKFSQGIIELKNTKFIKCYSMVDVVEHAQWPLAIDLAYGVKLEKPISFTINVNKK